MSTGLFSPMIVEYQSNQYVVEGLVSGGFPAFSNIEFSREKMTEAKVKVTSDVNGVLFVMRPFSKSVFQQNFIVMPVSDCTFVRYVEKCVMCEMPKDESVGG